eukprot:scaffold123287_cov30-Tisochrysis_lutea.AAC.1
MYRRVPLNHGASPAAGKMRPPSVRRPERNLPPQPRKLSRFLPAAIHVCFQGGVTVEATAMDVASACDLGMP